MQTLVWLGLGVLAVTVVIGVLRALADQASYKARGSGGLPPRRPADYNVDVVGESFYTQDFVAAFRAEINDDPDETVECDAVLKLDDHNPHDPKAVAVYVRGRQVGHLDRETARRYRKLLQGAATHGHTATVPAEVYLGGDDQMFSVRLAVEGLARPAGAH